MEIRLGAPATRQDPEVVSDILRRVSGLALGIDVLEHARATKPESACEVLLDLERATPVAGDPPSGVEIVSLAARPDLASAACDVEAAVAPDHLPGLTGHQPRTFERWSAENLEGAGALPEACLVALVNADRARAAQRSGVT